MTKEKEEEDDNDKILDRDREPNNTLPKQKSVSSRTEVTAK